MPPGRLPSGALIGEARPFKCDYGHAVAWGTEDDQVVQLPGGNPLEIGAGWPESVPFRQSSAWVVPIGDPGQIAFVFAIGDCLYTNWIGPGITLEKAEQYISSY